MTIPNDVQSILDNLSKAHYVSTKDQRSWSVTGQDGQVRIAHVRHRNQNWVNEDLFYALQRIVMKRAADAGLFEIHDKMTLRDEESYSFFFIGNTRQHLTSYMEEALRVIYLRHQGEAKQDSRYNSNVIPEETIGLKVRAGLARRGLIRTTLGKVSIVDQYAPVYLTEAGIETCERLFPELSKAEIEKAKQMQKAEQARQESIQDFVIKHTRARLNLSESVDIEINTRLTDGDTVNFEDMTFWLSNEVDVRHYAKAPHWRASVASRAMDATTAGKVAKALEQAVSLIQTLERAGSEPVSEAS